MSALERVYLRPATADRVRAGWLGAQIEQLVERLERDGYSIAAIRRFVCVTRAFGAFAQNEGAGEVAELPRYVDPFLAERLRHRHREPARSRGSFVSVLRAPVEALLRLSLPDFLDSRTRRVQRRPFLGAAPRFFDHLQLERGCRPSTILQYVHHLRAFEDFLRHSGAGLQDLSPVCLSGFVAQSDVRLRGRSMQTRCGVLRVFLRYLFREGIIRRDLSPAVERRRSYRSAGLPRSIPWPEVERVLGSVDRRTPVGKRDYAVLMLLVTYGLRAREIAALTLDDIDWKRERLHVPARKADHSTVYPLSSAVGQALAEYLRDGRPAAADRRVFFRVLAPVTPLPSRSISLIAAHSMRRAGVMAPRCGSHTLRHTCVQSLVNAGFSLKTIGDYVGHRSPQSTLIYAKVSVEGLRELALGDGEEALCSPDGTASGVASPAGSSSI